MSARERSVDAQWEAAIAELVARRLDATTAFERDLAGQQLLDLLTGRPAEAAPAVPKHNELPPRWGTS